MRPPGGRPAGGQDHSSGDPPAGLCHNVGWTGMRGRGVVPRVALPHSSPHEQPPLAVAGHRDRTPSPPPAPAAVRGRGLLGGVPHGLGRGAWVAACRLGCGPLGSPAHSAAERTALRRVVAAGAGRRGSRVFVRGPPPPGASLGRSHGRVRHVRRRGVRGRAPRHQQHPGGHAALPGHGAVVLGGSVRHVPRAGVRAPRSARPVRDVLLLGARVPALAAGKGPASRGRGGPALPPRRRHHQQRPAARVRRGRPHRDRHSGGVAARHGGDGDPAECRSGATARVRARPRRLPARPWSRLHPGAQRLGSHDCVFGHHAARGLRLGRRPGRHRLRGGEHCLDGGGRGAHRPRGPAAAADRLRLAAVRLAAGLRRVLLARRAHRGRPRRGAVAPAHRPGAVRRGVSHRPGHRPQRPTDGAVQHASQGTGPPRHPSILQRAHVHRVQTVRGGLARMGQGRSVLGVLRRLPAGRPPSNARAQGDKGEVLPGDPRPLGPSAEAKKHSNLAFMRSSMGAVCLKTVQEFPSDPYFSWLCRTASTRVGALPTISGPQGSIDVMTVGKPASAPAFGTGLGRWSILYGVYGRKGR
ncbi:hypothetical protein FOCC_FOCC003340 [Frankliniella occidentalis]|nr:hypothetical protein FOCC_FOCC003340 [Frankliniella occidentalis]